MKKLLKNAVGFGLVEVLMAAGLAGGIALTVAKLSQDANRVTKTTETNNEINMMMNDVAYILSDKANCNASIPSGTAANGANITQIRRVVSGTPQVVYSAGSQYGNNTFTISSMSTERIGATNDVRLVLNILRNNKVTTGSKTITKRIPLKAVLAGANIDSCFSDTENIITAAAQAACQGNSARWDAAAGECHHDIVLSPATCPDGQAPKQIDLTGGTATFTCQPISTTTCPAGQYQTGFNAAGTPICASIPCGVNQLIRKTGTDTFACIDVPVTCAMNQVLKQESGAFVCRDAYCPANQYLRGFSSTGAADCRALPTGTCPTDQYVTQVNPDGSVNCAPVPAGATLPQVDYSFVDGYNGGVWSRKSLAQTAQQICARITGFTWDGTNCIPTAAGTTDFEAICLKFPGHTWNGSQCVSSNESYKVVAFSLKFNGTSWSVGSTLVLFSTQASDKNINVVIDTVTGSGGNFKFRIHHNTYYMDSSEIISAVLVARDGITLNLRVGNVDGNNVLEFGKADDSTLNNYVNGDQINVIWATPRM